MLHCSLSAGVKSTESHSMLYCQRAVALAVANHRPFTISTVQSSIIPVWLKRVNSVYLSESLHNRSMAGPLLASSDAVLPDLASDDLQTRPSDDWFVIAWVFVWLFAHYTLWPLWASM